jgi:rhodanese-related sulfurtransferase
MRGVAQRALLIVVLGAGLGLIANAVSPKRIPLITPPKKAPQAEAFIPLEKAHEMWQSGTGFFMDARKPADFEAGHIPNALNLPEEDFAQTFAKLAPMLTADTSIVAYCDGKECELSHRLAEELKQQGQTNVHILFNVAITLPWIEVVAGVMLILGLWLVASVWLINLMTLTFIGAIASAVSRGLSIECGCFGTVGGRQVGLRAIAEDVLLLACGIWVLWRSAARPPLPGSDSPAASSPPA